MSLQTSTKIQILWQKFLQSDCGPYEKSAWFDAFLCEFLLNFKDGSQAQDIMPFTSLSGVATLISCELLSDVHQICSQPGDGEDLAPLRRHLLRGRGWRTLAVLHCLGIKDVTCASELASLLVSLYPVCLQTGQSQPQLTRKSGVTALQNTPAAQNLAPPPTVRNPYVLLNCNWDVCPSGGGALRHGHRSSYQLPGVTRLSPSGVSHYRKYSAPLSRSTTGTLNGSGGASHQSRVDQLKTQNNGTARQRKRSRSTMDPDSPKRHAIVTSESEAPQDAKLLINKSNTLKIRLNPMDFDYFDSVVRSEDERDQDMRWKDTGRRGSRKLTVEDLTDDGMREVRAQTVSPAELSQLIIHLVQDLCRSESPISTHQICLQAVNFALENLCSLQFGSAGDALSVTEVVTATSERKCEEVSPVESNSKMPEVAVEARTVLDSIRVVTRSMSSDLEIQSLNPYLKRLEDRLFETYFPDANEFSGDVNHYRTGSPDLVDFARSSAPMVLDDSLPKHMWKDMESATGERKMSYVPLDKTSKGPEEPNKLDNLFIAQTPTGESTEVALITEEVSGAHSAQLLSGEKSPKISYDRCIVSGESELPEALESEESFDGTGRSAFIEDLIWDDVFDDRILKARLGLPSVLTVADLKLTVSHLLLTALERVLHPEVIGALINAGVLPLMLRVLEDAIRKTEVIAKAARTTALTEEQERTAEGLQELVMGVLYGVAAFLHCLLLHRTSTEKIHEFEEQFRLFASSNGSRLIEKTVCALLNCNPAQREASFNKAKKVVTLVGQLIISLKQARSTLVHSLQCRKTRHKLCKANDTRRHHHHYNNLFGHPVSNISTSAMSASVVAQGGPCNVAYLFTSLVRILASHIQSPELALPLMKVMSDCGTCCCFPAKTLLNCLTKLLHSGNSKVRALGFDLLERTVFMELGATEANRGISNREHFRCSVCNQDVDSASAQSSVIENDVTDPNHKIDNVLKEDRFSDSCSSNHSDSLGIQDGNCLDFYRDLLCSNVPKLCHTAATHLLKLTPRCNERVQLALMTNVFYPSFIQAKERYLLEKSDMQKFILLSCLSAFACLMCTPSLAEHFLQLGGMRHILELMDLSPFVKLACSVLEIIITVDVVEWKAAVKGTFERKSDVGQEEVNNELLNIPSLKYLVESIENRSEELLDKLNGPDNEGSRRERLRPLHNVGALWRCAMNLSLCNPQLREFFAVQPVIGLGFRLLQAIFRRVVTFASLQGSGAGSDVLKEVELKCYLYMRLMEAILVLHFTSSPFSTRGILPLSEVLISDLRRTLCHREMTALRQSVTGVKTLRWLCDLLIHCSVAEPCNEEIIPALRKKPPAFIIASVWDSEQLDDEKEELEKENKVEETDCDRDDCADKEAFSEDGGSSVEEPYVTADEGYEADVEVRENGRGFSVPSDSESSSTLAGQTKLSGKDETSHSTKPARRPSPHNIVYPELCLLAVDFLVYINNHEDVNLEHSSESENDESSITTGKGTTTANSEEGVRPGTEDKSPVVQSHLLPDQIEIIQRLISLCRDNPKNCTALSNCKLMSSLLTGFSRALSTRNEAASPLQVVILELITLLAQHSISASELSKYLSFFKSKNPPLETLLQPLVALVTSARPQPNYILCFPVADIVEVNASIDLASSMGIPEPPPKITNLFGLGSHSGSSQRKSNENDPAENAASSLAQTFRKQHISEGLKTCWSQCAIALPVDSSLGWAMWAQGFSLSMWFRLERPPTEPAVDGDIGAESRNENNPCMSESLSDSWSEWGIISSDNSWLNDDKKSKRHGSGKFLHLVSVGTVNLTLELWCNVATDSFHLRLTRSDSRTCLLVAEAIFDSCLASGQWHHLAMNVKDIAKAKKSFVEVATIVDGCYEKKSSLSFTGPLPRKPRPTCVLVGHTSPAQTPVQGSWSLSSLQLFRQVVFTRERAVYVVGLGPGHTNLTECRIGRENPNFTTMFGSRTLVTGISWDSILDTGNANLREPQDLILLSYSAQNPNVVNVYPLVVNSSLFSGQSAFRVVTPEHRASQQLPLPLQPVLMVPLLTQQYHGLVAAASVLGGASVFLFLFARVVELNGTEVEQARALFLLLKLVQSDTQLFSQFVQNEYHKLLLKVLSSARCTPGHHVLKAVLDACCDKPVLQHQPGPLCQFRILHQSEAIVVNSFLLSTIIACWRDWGRAGTTAEDGGVLSTLFRALHVLLRDDHAYREFNAAQLNRVRLVEALLLFCKELFLYEEGCPLHPSVCMSLVELIRSLMGAPPEFTHVVAIADCLLLLHPASATYITHMRPSYYFLLSPSSPEPSPQIYSRKGHPAHYMYGDLESLKKKSSKRKSSRISDKRKQNDTNMRQPKINSAKLDKALTNLKIKQNLEEAMDVSSDEESGVPITGTSIEDQSCSESTGTMGTGNSSSVGESLQDRPSIGDNDTGLDSGDESKDEGKKEIIKEESPARENSDEGTPVPSWIGTVEDVKAKAAKVHKECVPLLTEENMPNLTDMKEKQLVLDWSLAACGESAPATAESEDQQRVVKSSDDDVGSMHSLVMEGLLLLLRDTLRILPDNMASQVVNHVVKAEMILVMMNNSNARVRAALVKVLAAYLHRATDEEINKFLKIKGFYLLASQLGLYPATKKLVEATASLVMQRAEVGLEVLTATLAEQAEEKPVEFLPVQLAALPALLALLPRMNHDLTLSHNTMVLFREIMQQSYSALRALLDAGVIEVLLKMLVFLAHQRQDISDTSLSSEQDALISEIHLFLLTIAGLVLNTSGAQLMEVLKDVQFQLVYLQQTEVSSCGVEARCVKVLRCTQCTVLEGSLDIVVGKLSSENAESVLNPHGTDVFNPLNWKPIPPPASNSSVSTVGSLIPHIRSPNKKIPKAELFDRFKTVVTKAVEYFVYSEPTEGIASESNSQEQNFVRRLLSLLIQGMCCVLDRRGSSVNNSLWNSVMWAARDILRLQTAHLLVWLLSPWQTAELRIFTIETIQAENLAKELLRSILNTHPQVEHKFTVWLWSLLYGPDGRHLEESEVICAAQLTEDLQRWGLVSPHLLGNPHESWMGDIALMLRETAQERLNHAAHNRAARDRSVFKMEGLYKQLVDAAMNATRNVVELQNSERKTFMEYIKSTYSENVHLRIKWQQLIQVLTHERAVWFFKESYPTSWQLDPTEGPARVRKRLQRSHLHIKPKFFTKCHREKLLNGERHGPLSFLFERDLQSTDASSKETPATSSSSRETCVLNSSLRETPVANSSSVLIERLHTNEKIQHMCSARVVTPSCEILGELLIGESCLYFVTDTSQNDMAEVTSGGVDMCSCAWQFDDVKEILNRRFLLKERAIEIFLVNGRTHLVAFQSTEERDVFLDELSQCELRNRISGERLSEIIEQWRDGVITNWEYLMQLNKLAGRSYNDLMQYPVLPFVLSDYVNTVLDLTDPSSFRVFSRPMAIQNPANEQHYINYYNDLKQGWYEGMNPCQKPHHYSSHYSNSGTVLHFLLRLPPYTRMFLQYQDNKFDLADRTFHSLHTTWRLTSSELTNERKELIPEFFFLPEFLVNNEGFDLGVRQNGERVDTVELPPWSNGNARTFVLVHRQALESDYVRENLMHWIDLVFGYKQSGEAAFAALNLFHPATYTGFDITTIENPQDRLAWETMIRTYGQTPRQLFKHPHPMVVQSLVTKASNQSVRPVINSVKGLVWGSYVGSPAEPEPSTAWKHTHRNLVAQLVSLQTNDVFGLAPNTTILLNYCSDKNAHTPTVQGVALVTWGHADSIVRVKLKKDHPPWPILRSHDLDPITLCASTPDCAQLWVGHTSGRITVHKYTFDPARQHLDFSNEPVNLFGHTGPVLDLSLCRSFSIAVSASQDGSAIIWDLNNLSYVRTIWHKSVSVERPVRLCGVSETLGDIVTVCHERKSVRRANVEKNSYCPWDTAPLSRSDDMRSSPTPLSDDWEIVADVQPEDRKPVRSSSWSALRGLPKWQSRQRASSQGSSKDEKPSPTSSRGSVLYLHSVNASLVGKILTKPRITAVCFSTAPEGVSVNVIATGLESGVIRLWSTWDLTPVRDISSPVLTHPIVSLAYSRDSQQLYASTTENVVVVFESGGSKNANKPPKFHNVSYL